MLTSLASLSFKSLAKKSAAASFIVSAGPQPTQAAHLQQVQLSTIFLLGSTSTNTFTRRGFFTIRQNSCSYLTHKSITATCDSIAMGRRPQVNNSHFLAKSQQKRCFATMGQQMTYDKKNDLYDILGVKADTEMKQIKLAYYKMAQKYHPDKAGDEPKTVEKFKTISSAYEVLVDENQRKQYDALRMQSKQTRGYSSRKSNQFGGGQASSQSRGQSKGGRRDAQDDFFYGGFKNKQDFYEYYSNFNDGKGTGTAGSNDSAGSQRQYNDHGSSQNFYRTSSDQQRNEKRRSQSQQENGQTSSGRQGGGFDEDDPFGGTTFNSKRDRQERGEGGFNQGYRASDHYEKWGKNAHSEEAHEDFTRKQYEQWTRAQSEYGKKQKSNFNKFYQNRHKIQTDAERRAEREAKYGKYDPEPESGFNSKNRAYQWVQTRNTFEAFLKGQSMFKINRENHAKKFHGRSRQLNESFENAKNLFDKQTHESMTRRPLDTEDVKKMVDPKKVLGACLLISGLKKTVDRIVQ